MGGGPPPYGQCPQIKCFSSVMASLSLGRFSGIATSVQLSVGHVKESYVTDID